MYPTEMELRASAGTCPLRPETIIVILITGHDHKHITKPTKICIPWNPDLC